jgi:hypothetical protein
LCDIVISAVYIMIFAGEDAIKPVQHMLWDGHYIADPDIVGRCAER